uniref:Orc1-like AAA ATPase domain-containing protein n=1 Tax=Biomphalaria glabrata TaxID=6526 RepID=A0A2C9KJL5_BIOGL
MDLIVASRSNQSHNSQPKKFGVEIRRDEKDFLKALLLPGNIVQVHGPPMVGKSMLVDQVISEIQSELGSTCKVHQYCVDCKNITCFEDILERTLESMGIAPASVLPATIEATLTAIDSVLRSNSSCQHIVIFQKCQALRLSGNERKFLQLVASLAYQNVSGNGKVTVVFTSFVDFLIQGANVKHVYIGMLVDPHDIEALLRHYSQEVEDLSECVLFCKRFLGFPEGIIRIAEEYLLSNSNSPSGQYLEEILNTDLELVHLMFTKRLADVFSWLDEQDLLFVYKCQPISFLRTYSEGMCQCIILLLK